MSKAEFTIHSYTKEERAQFEAALMEYEGAYTSKKLQIGDTLSGQLLGKTDKEVVMYAFGKCNVTIPITSEEKPFIENALQGERCSVLITDIIDNKDGFEVVGSIAKLKASQLNDFLTEAADNNTVLTGIPVEMNHAGYNVKININNTDMIFFMPHLVTSVNKLSNPESILNKEMEIILDEYKKEGQTNFIASHKKYLQTLIPSAMKQLQKKGEYEGVVTGPTDFGIFVQFNKCLTGLIHKSNLNEETLQRLLAGEIKNGDPITFFVKDFIKDNIFLTQVLKDSLWDSIKVDQELTGEISSIKEFGIMVQLDFETKGLLHLSVLDKPLTEYHKGDKINVVVTNVNKNKRQITLALKK